MSGASIPESLWRRDPPPPRWWGRGARFAYGLVVLATGLAGETWATSRDDTMGLAISGAILVIACGILLGAVLSPTWPAIAKALEAAQRAAAPLWSRVVDGLHKAASLATTAAAATARWLLVLTEPVLTAGRATVVTVVRLSAVAAGKVASVAALTASRAWRRTSPVLGRLLTRLVHIGMAIARRIATVMSTTVAVTRRVLAACWRAIASVGDTVVALVRLPVRGLTVLVLRISAVIARSCHLVAVPVLGVAAVLLQLVRASSRVLAAMWGPTATLIRRSFAWTGQQLAATWPPIVTFCARVARKVQHVVLVLWDPVASAAGRTSARTRRVLATAWRPIGSVLTRFASGLSAAVGRGGRRLSKELTPGRLTLVVVELLFVGLALAGTDLWTWWLDGERMTGEVIETGERSIGPAATITIVDADSDRLTTVWLAFGLGSIDEGDTATAILVPSDPSRGGTPALVAGLITLWMLLPVSALLWPLWWRSRWRHRLPQAWPRMAPVHPT